MTDLVVRPFLLRESEDWDRHVAGSWNGTFLHTRKFLSYHGERFNDSSLLITDNDGEMLGVFPAATDPRDDRRVVSHPGITYGGVVHSGQLRGEAMIAAIRAIRDFYRAAGYLSLRYKAVPLAFQLYPTGDDLYALFRLGATRFRCDLSSIIDLPYRQPVSENCARNLKRAMRNGLSVSSGSEHLPHFWDVLSRLLFTKHGTAPVHSLREIDDLVKRFPDRITCTVALDEGIVVAGVVTFSLPRTLHMQYSASSERGQKMGGPTLVLEQVIAAAVDEGLRYFSFGISTEQEGLVLNEGLYRFKSGFGAGSMMHESYDLSTGEQ